MRLIIKLISCLAVLTTLTVWFEDAVNRRAAYLDDEAAYYMCVKSGLSRAECVAGVFGDVATAR